MATMLKEHLENVAQFAVRGADMRRERGGSRGLPSTGLCADQVSLLGRRSLRAQDARGTLSPPGFHPLERPGEQFTHQASHQIHLLRRLERGLDTQGECMLVETAQTA